MTEDMFVASFSIFNSSKEYLMLFMGVLAFYRIAVVEIKNLGVRGYCDLLTDIIFVAILLVAFVPLTQSFVQISEQFGPLLERKISIEIPISESWVEWVERISAFCYSVARFIFKFLVSSLISFGAVVIVFGIMLKFEGVLKGYFVVLAICLLWPLVWLLFNLIIGQMFISSKPELNAITMILGDVFKLIGSWAVAILAALKPLLKAVSPIIGAVLGTGTAAKTLGSFGAQKIDGVSGHTMGIRPIQATKRGYLGSQQYASNIIQSGFAGGRNGAVYGAKLVAASTYHGLDASTRQIRHLGTDKIKSMGSRIIGEKGMNQVQRLSEPFRTKHLTDFAGNITSSERPFVKKVENIKTRIESKAHNYKSKSNDFINKTPFLTEQQSERKNIPTIDRPNQYRKVNSDARTWSIDPKMKNTNSSQNPYIDNYKPYQHPNRINQETTHVSHGAQEERLKRD